MEAKPIVTCHGDQSLFSQLHASVLHGLPKEACEWKRSYGRAPRTLKLEASFVPYDADILPDEDDRILISRPYFHIYWTDCDLEGYKQSVKEDIAEWQTALKARNIPDWLIVVVVMDESKVKSKILPRSSVIDKVKSDFCSKAQERCVVLTEPLKTDPKSAESWYNFFNSRLRPLLLQAYNRQLGRFEDNMRALREKRNDPAWNYMEYFVVQEELAFMFEILGVFDDALLQYDELDALFTQFAENHAAGAHVKWLSPLIQPLSSWSGLSLSKPLDQQLRDTIKMNQASVLEFRNYLFSRQCALLFLMNRPTDVAQRALDYLHYTVQEIIALEVEIPEGALWCWVFLSSLEVLEASERYTDHSRHNRNSLCTASLWDYARRKLQELGKVCGLMPGTMPSSRHLSSRVDLTSGMVNASNEETRPTDKKISPLDRLRQALSSDDAYRKHYLEMCELAMGTYKHISRFRSARIIGRDLADFYMLLGEPQKAEVFLLDAIKMYKQEGWEHLADGTMLELALCQAKMDDNVKYLKTACQIACSPHLKMADREHYFKDVMKLAEDKDEMCVLKASNILSLEGAEVMTPSVILNDDFIIDTKIHSHFPHTVTCNKVSISVSSTLPQHQPSPSHFSKKKISHTRTPSLTNHKPEHIANFQPIRKQLPALIDATATYEKRQGKVVGAGVTCKNANELLKRTDSGPGSADVDHMMKGDFSECLLAEDVELKPGENDVQLRMKTSEKGVFRLSQLCFELKHLDFLKSLTTWDLFFRVVCDQPTVQLKPTESDYFIAGIKQNATLTLNTGSFSLPHGCSAQFKTVENLEVFTREGNSVLKLTQLETDESSEFGTTVFHQTNPTFDRCTNSKLTCHIDLWDRKLDYNLSFIHPFQVSHALHTCKEKKFLQISIGGNTKTAFHITEPELSAINSKDVELQLMNRPGQELNVNMYQTVCILWQICCNIPDIPRLEFDFSFRYTSPLDLQDVPRKYMYTCSVENFQTQYIVSYDVMSGDEDKVCRAGRNSSLRLQVRRCEEGHGDPDQRLVYDVKIDENTWALAGKSTGVFCLKDDFYETVLDIVPVTAGFIHLPVVNLHKYKTGHDDNKMKGVDLEDSEKLTEFVEFSHGEVYNGSRTKQIHVYPESGGKDVEVSTV